MLLAVVVTLSLTACGEGDTVTTTATFAVYGPTDNDTDGFIRCENKSVPDSLRVKAIKKVDAVSGYTPVKTLA